MTQDVLIPEMMLRFKCNQKGCCCKGWRIPFDDDDLVALLRPHTPEERSDIVEGMKVLVDKDTELIHEVQLKTIMPERSCQFLDVGRCGLQASKGVDVLPKICRSFPAHAQRVGQGMLELHYDAVCPEVLEQLDEDDAPFRLTKTVAERGTELEWRTLLKFSLPPIQLGERAFLPEELWSIRAGLLEAIEHEGARGGTAIDVLARINYAMARLVASGEGLSAFEIREGEPVEPFEEFMELSMMSHQPQVLLRLMETYERFIYAIPLGDDVDWSSLLEHLKWQEDWRDTLDLRAPELQPLLLRYLGHRFFSAFDRLPEDRQLGFNYGTVTHGLATAFRYAIALSRWTNEPLNRNHLKVGMGASEYLYRTWRMLPSTMPWFGLEVDKEIPDSWLEPDPSKVRHKEYVSSSKDEEPAS